MGRGQSEQQIGAVSRRVRAVNVDKRFSGLRSSPVVPQPRTDGLPPVIKAEEVDEWLSEGAYGSRAEHRTEPDALANILKVGICPGSGNTWGQAICAYAEGGDNPYRRGPQGCFVSLVVRLSKPAMMSVIEATDLVFDLREELGFDDMFISPENGEVLAQELCRRLQCDGLVLSEATGNLQAPDELVIFDPECVRVIVD